MTHEMGSTALWLMLLLGAYHGINPGMGWLFAVALGVLVGTSVTRDIQAVSRTWRLGARR